mmetsp:Transcript_39160/g.58951  ORF Transcript_39160/g.58951 Transcript_39160/m.58951 type:complete len:206 (+) Transcript_39160:530-1147(+)
MVIAIGGDDEVVVSIIINIHSHKGIRSLGLVPPRNQNLSREVTSPVVGIPRNGTIILGSRCQINPPIPIQIRRNDRPRPNRIIVHNLLDLAKGAVDHVLKHGNGVVPRGSGRNVRIAIVIKIRHRHSLPLVHSRRNDVLREIARTVVLEPSQRRVVVRCTHNVDVAVAVHVGHRHDATAQRRPRDLLLDGKHEFIVFVQTLVAEP